MGSVDVLGIDPVELAHASRQIRIRRLHQEMVVIGHQAVGMAEPVEALTGRCEDVEKRYTVIVDVSEKDAAPLVATRRDMVQRTGKRHP
jgi:hypothetical protein